MTNGEPISTLIQEEVKKEFTIPIGERIIGEIDPRTLTEDYFNNSPEILFHAAAKPFVFLQNIDYSTLHSDFSSTVGRGLYTTNNPESAQKYLADRRTTMGGENSVLMRFLPYQSRMYDMRATNSEQFNAPVPRELFEKYREFVINLFKSKYGEGVVLNPYNFGTPDYMLFETLREHKSFLNTLYFKDGAPAYKPVDLRVMLGIDGTMNTSEKGSYPFTLFMLNQGYDGLIYNEGGDGWADVAPSYVFYNPKKVGTYQDWHEQTIQANS